MKYKIIMMLSAISLFFLSNNMYAYPGGVSGRTLKGPSPGCSCHTSTTNSNVSLTITGPSSVNTGQSADYQVVVTYNSTISGGGIDIAASNGTLTTTDSKLKLLNAELTHSSAQNTGSDTITWNFTYTAPSSPGTDTLYATGTAEFVAWNNAPNFAVNVTSSAAAVDIAHTHMNDSTGVSQDTGMIVTVTGTVTVAKEFGGLSFMQDSTAGIAFCNCSIDSSDLKIGDVLSITGKVINYNGLTKIKPVHAYSKTDSGQTVEPRLLTIPDINNQAWNGFEAYEGMLVRINGVNFTTPVTIFEGDASYFIVTGTDTLEIRINAGTDLVNQPAPQGAFDIIGVVNQYKTSPPYNTGYQLMPRFMSDVMNATAVNDNGYVPAAYLLEQNYPNPFNPSTEIKFSLKESGFVTLRVYNAIGEQVAELINGNTGAGEHSIHFNAAGLNSGIYFYTLKAGNNSLLSRKMVLLK